jgi:hypothetical protein
MHGKDPIPRGQAVDEKCDPDLKNFEQLNCDNLESDDTWRLEKFVEKIVALVFPVTPVNPVNVPPVTSRPIKKLLLTQIYRKSAKRKMDGHCSGLSLFKCSSRYRQLQRENPMRQSEATHSRRESPRRQMWVAGIGGVAKHVAHPG